MNDGLAPLQMPKRRCSRNEVNHSSQVEPPLGRRHSKVFVLKRHRKNGRVDVGSNIRERGNFFDINSSDQSYDAV